MYMHIYINRRMLRKSSPKKHLEMYRLMDHRDNSMGLGHMLSMEYNS